MNIVRYPLPPWPEELETREAEFDVGEAIEAMREHQEMLRLDDHVPLPEFALPGGSFWLSLLMLAAAIATICVVGLAVHVSFS